MTSFKRLCIIALLTAAAVECAALLALPFRGYDTYCHIYWIAQWHKLWNVGIFYPRWLPDSFKGFGAPSFYFYPPLAFFLTSALYALLPNISAAAIGKTLGILIFAASGAAMWLYLRWRGQNQFASKTTLWAVLLYMFAPYRFFDYAVRGAISEHAAFVFVPFVFWGIDLLAERRTDRDTRRGFFLLSFSIALLLLSNLPAAAVAGLGAIVYVLTRDTKSRDRLFGQFIASSAIAVILTSFYLLPIIVLFADVQFGRLWLPVSIMLSSPFLAIFSGKGLMINTYAFLSLIGACILLVGMWSKKDLPAARTSPFFWMLVLIVFVQLPYVSNFLFYRVPPFTIIQLSYRFSVLLLVVIVLAWQNENPVGGETENRKILRPRPFVSYVVLLWSFGAIGLAGLQLANVHVHQHDLLPLGEAPEYAPRWSRPYYDFGASLSAPFATDTTWAIWRGETSASVQDQRLPYSDTVEYSAPWDGSILLRRSYWPTWKANIDGVPTTTSPDSLGRLLIPAPVGNHRIVVALSSESSATIGTWISLATLAVLCVLWVLA